MKFLHVITSMNPRTGGPCQGVRNLATWFTHHDASIEVACLDDPNSSFLGQEQICIHALGSSRSQWGYNSKLLPWLNQNISKFDAVILNGLWQYAGYALYQATRKPNAPPYFVFPHGMLDPWFQRNPQRRLKAIRNWIYWKLIEQRVVRNAEALLFTSVEEMRLARTTFSRYQPKREINVGYGIPEPPEYRKEMDAAFIEKCPALNGSPYFLYLSRIHPKKGLDLLIHAYADFCRLQSEVPPSLRTKLVIAGPGVETFYGQQMQTLARQICPPDSVFWPGMVAGDAKWGAIYNCEIFALPSHQENFGIAVVEALACSRPVLISNQVNIWREIEEDAAGLVAEDSLKGMKALFWRWAGLSDDYKAIMRKAARACYENRFTVAYTARCVQSVLADLTSRSRSPGLPQNHVGNPK